MGKFNFTPGRLEGVIIIDPASYGDDRGFFMESYSRRDFQAAGLPMEFVQDNHSCSRRGVVRGLHFQRVKPQGKLVRVVRGSILDVAVDLRPGSPTFCQWETVLLSAENRREFYIPPGFGHGFLALEDDTHLIYKCTQYYYPQFDAGIVWNDKKIGIDWEFEKHGLGASGLILSAKDLALPTVAESAPDYFE